MAEKQSLISGISAGLSTAFGPWKLTPTTPDIPGRAHLQSWNVDFIFLRASNGGPVYQMGADGRVWLRFEPPAIGKKYLIDCKVSKEQEHYFYYRVTVWPGAAQQTFTNTDHLVVVYEAVSGEEAVVLIQSEELGRFAWSWYSCELTMLD